jgi:pilus assembly protein Flp/PilA
VNQTCLPDPSFEHELISLRAQFGAFFLASLINWRQPMRSFFHSIQRFLISEDGPTAVEYAVMLALIIIVALAAIQAVGTRTSATFNNIATQLPSA